MAFDQFVFRWPVPIDGYRWDRARTKDGFTRHREWVLTGRWPGEEGYTGRTYAPLHDHPALFRTLADVPFDDRDAILAFANQYGRLGVGEMVNAESHADWAKEIFDLRQAVTIWDLFRDKDHKGLARFLRWHRAKFAPDGRQTNLGGWYYDSHPELPEPEIPFPARLFDGVYEHELERLAIEPGDVLMPAQLLVLKWVNKKLGARAAPRLFYHTEQGQPVMRIVPFDLITAVWLQFVHAVAGKKDYKTCKECGQWFEVSGDEDGRTARKVFCSPKCKTRDYRKRRAGKAARRRSGKKGGRK
jgi:hypothetical protein